MEQLLLLAVPIVVTGLVQAIKQLQTIKLSEQKALILRFLAVTASFGGVVAVAISTGQEVPLDQIDLYAQAFIAFTATQIPYLLGKRS